MSSSVTAVKYSYQEHHTVGAGRGAGVARASAQAASAPWIASGPEYEDSVTGPSALISARPSWTASRIEGTEAAGSGAAHSRTGEPSPGSSASSPSPWKPAGGAVRPGR